MPLLSGKKILVTGLLSNRSIAYGIAKAAHREGAARTPLGSGAGRPGVPKMTTRLNTAQAAAAIGITPNTLKLWRFQGRGPRFIKYGPERNARCAYDSSDIDAWLEARKYSSTTEATVAATEAERAAMPKPPSAPVIAPWLQPTV